MVGSQLLLGKVFHTRTTPRKHHFWYKMFYLVIESEDLVKGFNTRFLSLNRFNLFSVYTKDYGFDSSVPLKDYVVGAAIRFGISASDIAKIQLITMPRILGFAFNPVSFWILTNPQGEVIFVLTEVNNTFGERHSYGCHLPNFDPITVTTPILKPKVFHVSPFCKVDGEYTFLFDIKPDKISLKIDFDNDPHSVIQTGISGKVSELLDRTLLNCFFKIPFMTLKVVLMINFHALRLWIKKIPFYSKPQKPTEEVT